MYCAFFLTLLILHFSKSLPIQMDVLKCKLQENKHGVVLAGMQTLYLTISHVKYYEWLCNEKIT